MPKANPKKPDCPDGCFNRPERWQTVKGFVVCKICGKYIGRAPKEGR
jgi:hypothetical protein